VLHAVPFRPLPVRPTSATLSRHGCRSCWTRACGPGPMRLPTAASVWARRDRVRLGVRVDRLDEPPCEAVKRLAGEPRPAWIEPGARTRRGHGARQVLAVLDTHPLGPVMSVGGKGWARRPAWASHLATQRVGGAKRAPAVSLSNRVAPAPRVGVADSWWIPDEAFGGAGARGWVAAGLSDAANGAPRVPGCGCAECRANLPRLVACREAAVAAS
jgi:hypothetical protein